MLNAKSAYATTNNTATKQQDNKTTSIVWKTIPSEARVTRDEVSGYMIQTKTAVWKTVPCIGWIPMLLVQSSRQLSFSFYNPETSSAGYSCFARLRQRPFPSLYKKEIKSIRDNASARFFTLHFSLFTFHFSIKNMGLSPSSHHETSASQDNRRQQPC